MQINIHYIYVMTERQKTVLQRVLNECFWGDYRLTLETAVEKLAGNDRFFERFIISRIIADSPFPSARLRVLFPLEKLRSLLDSIKMSGRTERRRTLARAILFHEPWEAEPSWIRT